METFRSDDEAAIRWRSVVESAVDGIIVIDATGRIEAFNPAAERLFGYRESELLGQNVKVLMPSPYHEEHDGYLKRYLETGVPTIIGKGREVTGRRRDGSTFPVHLSVGEMALGSERKFTGILHDLSDRVRMEEQLREQAALARLGEMAAVVAHEVRNPLAGVRGAIQTLKRRFAPDSPDAELTTQIIARIDGLNDLMNQLLLFARPPQPRLGPVYVEALVAATADLLNADPVMREIRVEVDGRCAPIFADAELLRIVFMNLIVNSGQAMNGCGTIRVEVGSTDGSCRIAFIDTGPGMSRDVRDKVFTPFFTTKRSGTGLGLATAKRLVEAHRGTIGIACPSEGGTTVIVQLPVARP